MADVETVSESSFLCLVGWVVQRSNIHRDAHAQCFFTQSGVWVHGYQIWDRKSAGFGVPKTTLNF